MKNLRIEDLSSSEPQTPENKRCSCKKQKCNYDIKTLKAIRKKYYKNLLENQ
ncbi:Hypothetical protein FKW44_003266, partial [Caligus rogercresseyi]